MKSVGSNAVKESVYRDVIDQWIDMNVPLRDIIKEIQATYDPAFNEFGLTTLSLYAKERRESREVESRNSMSDVGINVDKAVRNDGHVLDYIIQKGFETLIDNGGTVGVTDIFRAIDRKGKILGASYKGQTVWALLDNQQAMLRLFELIHECVPGKYVDVLIERAVQEGLCTPADVIHDDIEDDIDKDIDLLLQ